MKSSGSITESQRSLGWKKLLEIIWPRLFFGKQGLRLGYLGSSRAKHWIFTMRKIPLFLGNSISMFICSNFLYPCGISLVPIASCPVVVHPCEESALIFIATFRYWKFLIRFPQAFASWDWTNPVPSTFLCMSGSSALRLSQWPGLSPVFSGSKDCIGVLLYTHLGTYMLCWVRHKTQPCMNILWKTTCLLLCRAWGTCRTCCKSIADQSCTQVSEKPD